MAYNEEGATMANRSKYFAALPKDEVGGDIMRRITDWYSNISTSGMIDRMKKSYFAYYGYSNTTSATSSDVTRGGLQGELALIKVNHLRNLIQHILVMTTSNRPAMEARAENTDYKSLTQTILANNILEYYMREKNLEQILKIATEMALVLSEGYVRLSWDSSEGDEYRVDPRSGRIIHTGDIKYHAHNPLDIIKDMYKDNAYDDEWKIVRHWKNKFDIAAKYPEYHDDIIGLSYDYDEVNRFNFLSRPKQDETEIIPVYEFYHRRSDALPDGRQLVLLNEDIILFDGPLPYHEIPIYRITPGEFLGTTYGFTPAYDLLAMQEVIDALYSSVVTNQTTFGVQNLLLPKGHDLNYSQLGGALNILEYDSQVGKPEAMNLTYTPPEIFTFITNLEQVMETLSGVNSVARGNPEPNLRSGNALALIQSMAIQFNSGLQQSYAKLLEDVGTATIKTLKDFAAAPRLVMIVGKSNRTYVKSFTGKDLDKVNRIIVDVANPLSKTIAGKIEIADNLLQNGMIESPQQYIELIKTGNLDTMLEGDLREQMLIKAENEKLSDGSDKVIAIATDNHKLHIQEHKAVLADPDLRFTDPTIVENTLNHIDEHINLLRDTDPAKLIMFGQEPIPPDQGQPGAPGQPGEQPPQQGAPGQIPEVVQTEALLGNQVEGLPNMPKNPLTGETFNPQIGGLPGGIVPPQ